jgi:predicted porin
VTTAPAFWPAVKSDPFGWDGVGQIGLDMWAGFRTPNPNTLNGLAAASPTNPTGQTGFGSNVRAANTVGYKSPSFGGLTVQLASGLGENVVVATTASTSNTPRARSTPRSATSVFTVAARARSPWPPTPGMATRWSTSRSTTTSASSSRCSITPQAHVDLTDAKNKFWSLGALAPIGPGNLKAAYYKWDPEGSNNNRQKFGIGYDYPLSKRTNLYADLGYQKGDNLTSNTTYSVGAKHTF